MTTGRKKQWNVIKVLEKISLSNNISIRNLICGRRERKENICWNCQHFSTQFITLPTVLDEISRAVTEENVPNICPFFPHTLLTSFRRACTEIIDINKKRCMWKSKSSAVPSQTSSIRNVKEGKKYLKILLIRWSHEQTNWRACLWNKLLCHEYLM